MTNLRSATQLDTEYSVIFGPKLCIETTVTTSIRPARRRYLGRGGSVWGGIEGSMGRGILLGGRA